MPDPFEYISRSRLEYRHGYRHAYLGDVPAPVVYGVQGGLREYYGVAEGPPVASTLDLLSAMRNEANAIDRAETRMYNRPRGGLTLYEQSSLNQAAKDVAGESDATASCNERAKAEKARVETILANPQALQAQADKLRVDLRQYRAQLNSQLVALITHGHSLAKALLGGVLPPNFSEQVQGLKKNVDATCCVLLTPASSALPDRASREDRFAVDSGAGPR